MDTTDTGTFNQAGLTRLVYEMTEALDDEITGD